VADQPDRVTIGIVGLGKVATDRHVPAIEDDERLQLICTADPFGVGLPGIRHFADLDALLAADRLPDAIAVCTPPQQRYALARRALDHGLHVLLEKPPGTTVGEVEHLRALAEQRGLTLFCAWHSRFTAAVLPAREWLAAREIRRVRIEWREDVRVWHPGQTWIWEPGGFGVFDTGINALSVASAILPRAIFLVSAQLHYPENCQTPIAAELEFSDSDATQITAAFDFLQTGPQTWEISIATDAGELVLSQGGTRLFADGGEMPLPERAAYPALYAHFAGLVRGGLADADTTPLRLVADAFMLGRRVKAPAFNDPATD